jgi:hypothetical protein
MAAILSISKGNSLTAFVRYNFWLLLQFSAVGMLCMKTEVQNECGTVILGHLVYTSQFPFADLSLGKLPSVPRKFCPVGKLLPGVHVLVMDDEMNVEPVGVSGEVRVEKPSHFSTIFHIRYHTLRP